MGSLLVAVFGWLVVLLALAASIVIFLGVQAFAGILAEYRFGRRMKTVSNTLAAAVRNADVVLRQLERPVTSDAPPEVHEARNKLKGTIEDVFDELRKKGQLPEGFE